MGKLSALLLFSVNAVLSWILSEGGLVSESVDALADEVTTAAVECEEP